jgi:beta-barrel assembly-enhancing protease
MDRPGRPQFRVVAWVVLVSVLTSACATRNVPPIGANGQPFRPETDERALWAEAEREERQLLKKAKPYRDPRLDAYLARIGDRLIPESVRAAGGPGFTFGVISDPTLNAFAMPNGHVYVHTGLLSQLDNESQLATILGHEITHVTDRHALRFQRDRPTTPILDSVAAVAASIGVAAMAGSRPKADDPIGGAVITETANAILGLRLQLAAIAAINGYGRDLERVADVKGLERMVKAGYDPREAPRVFELLLAEGPDRGPLETFFFGNHPRLRERIETTRRLLQTQYASAPASPTRDSEDFRLRTHTVVRDNARLDVQAGRFGLAQKQLDRVLAITPNDPVAHLFYGDLHRLQAQRAKSPADETEHAQTALGEYRRAAELDPKYPDPFRQLGLLYYQQKDTARAQEAFRRYLALKPDAPDATRIKEYIVELAR